MKYYYNKETKLLLIDENDSTPYLKDRGYTKITKKRYQELEAELFAEDLHIEEEFILEDPGIEDQIVEDQIDSDIIQ